MHKIRPVLESYCRILYPGEFAGHARHDHWQDPDRRPAPLSPVLEDLDMLNEYTCRYHHGENPNAATEPINDTELQGFVKRTLVITGGC